MLPAEPSLHELYGRLVTESRVLPFSVVEDLDVFKGRSLDLGMGRIANTMHPLILETVEPALRRRVIPAVAFTAHRAVHAAGLELVLKDMAGVLAASVGVVHQSRYRTPPEPGHGQCIGHDIRRHARFQRPADNLAVEQVEHDGQIQPAFIGRQVGDVRGPDLIWRRRREVSGQQVLCHRQAVLRVRRDLVAPLVPGADPVVAHQPFDSFLAGRETSYPQFTNHARAAVGPFEFGMNGPDERQQLAVAQSLAIRRAAMLPGPIAADADVEDVTHFRQGKRPALLGNPGVLHRASFAKYAAAFFMISSSRLSRDSRRATSTAPSLQGSPFCRRRRRAFLLQPP